MNLTLLKKKFVRKFLPWRDKEYQLEIADRRAMRSMWTSIGSDFVGRLIQLPWKDSSQRQTFAITIPSELVDHLRLKVSETYEVNINEAIEE